MTLEEYLEEGRVVEFLVVSADDGPYARPALGTSWSLLVRGRRPSRCDLDRQTGRPRQDFLHAKTVQLSFEVRVVIHPYGRSGLAYIEGVLRDPMLSLVTAYVALGTGSVPVGLLNLLAQDGVGREDLKALIESRDAPLGFVRVAPSLPPSG